MSGRLRSMRRAQRKSRARFSFRHSIASYNSMSTAGTSRPSSGPLELDETLAQPPAPPGFQATIKSQPGSGPSGCLGLRDADCFQAGGCLSGPPERPRATPKPRSQGDVARRPYRAGVPRSAVQPSPKKESETQRALAPEPYYAGHAETDPREVHGSQAAQARQDIAGPSSASPRYSAFPRPDHKQTYQALGVQLFRIPEEIDKWHEIGVVGLNLPPSTPTAGQAGLAVTSANQKDTGKHKCLPEPRSRTSPDRRPRCPGTSPLVQEATPMESSSIGAADLPIRDILSPATANGVPQGDQKQNTEDQRGGGTLSSSSGNTSHTSRAPAEPVQPPSVKPQLMKSRPSAVFRTAKCLPATPKSSSVSNDAETNSLSSGSGVESRRLDDGAEHRQRSTRLNASLPATTMGKREKTMASLPMPLVPPRTRRAVAAPVRKARAPPPRPRPTAITEDDEPSPEKLRKENRNPNTPQRSGPHADTIVQGRDGYGKGVGVIKAGFAETSNQSTNTPSSSETALNDVLSALESLETEQHRTETPRLYSSGRRRGALEILSPPRRLQRAAMMRRQRMAETASQGLEVAGQPGVSDTMSRPDAASKPEAAVATSLGASDPNVNKQGKSSAEEDKDISDHDVLKGLKIMCAASADVEFDALVRNKTGLRLRRFLADLQSFEQLSELGLGGEVARLESGINKQH